MQTKLSVNINKIATLRNSRGGSRPNVLQAAIYCQRFGADGITVHPRPDERHIRASDVHDLAQLMKDWPDREYNIEGNPSQNLMDFIRAVRPHQATFVPDGEGQFTSDHGWNLVAYLCLGFPAEEHLDPELERHHWEVRSDLKDVVFTR